jgi:hypothetical protein
MLRDEPDIDINQNDGTLYAASSLSISCIHGHAFITEVLLAHPLIDVNYRSMCGRETPFLWACYGNNLEVIKRLLDDPRVGINTPDSSKRTAIWYCVRIRNYNAIVQMLMSGRPFFLGTKGKADYVFDVENDTPTMYWNEFDDEEEENDTAYVTRSNEILEKIKELLRRYESDPKEVVDELRKELQWYVSRAADLFAIIVFVSDGLLSIKESDICDKGTSGPKKQKRLCENFACVKKHGKPCGTTRFFKIAERLPMEIQMMLCRRFVESVEDIIPRVNVEAAIVKLGHKCVVVEQPKRERENGRDPKRRLFFKRK